MVVLLSTHVKAEKRLLHNWGSRPQPLAPVALPLPEATILSLLPQSIEQTSKDFDALRARLISLVKSGERVGSTPFARRG